MITNQAPGPHVGGAGTVRGRFLTRLTYALHDYRTIGLEGHLACSAITGGVWVAAVGFNRVSLLAHLPQTIVGALMVGHGLLYLRALLVELSPNVPRSPANLKLCLRGAVFSVCLWATIWASFILAPPRTAFAVPLTFVNMLGSLWVATRLALKEELDGATR